MKKYIFLIALFFSPLLLLMLQSFGGGAWRGAGEAFSQNPDIDSLLSLLKNDKPDTNKVKHLNNLCLEYINIGLYDTSVYLGNAAYKLAQELVAGRNSSAAIPGIKKSIANAYNNIGIAYFYQGNYPQTLEYWLKALKTDEEFKDKNGVAKRLGNIGAVFMKQKDYPKALDYLFKSLKMMEELDMKKGISNVLGNIGIVYKNQGEYSKSLECYFKALKIDEELGSKSGSAADFGNIGSVYDSQKDYYKALDYYLKALEMGEATGDKNIIVSMLGNIGSIYTTIGKFKEAEQYLKRSTMLEDSIGALDGLRQDEEALSDLYDALGKYKEAFMHYKKAIALKDSLYGQERKKELIRKEMNYEFDKKEAATKAEYDKAMTIAQAEKKKQQIITWSIACGLFLVALFSGLIFRSLRITRKQKNIIELQKNEVSKQKEIVEKQKTKIIDSITYAQRIQQSILMEESEIQNYLPESFIYYQPKDIVSGDFYWFSKIDGSQESGERGTNSVPRLTSPDSQLIIAAADCTGHGVPGAFMSTIGNLLLNQIINEKHITQPSEILTQLNQGVYEALHQKKSGISSEDGMDIALCIIDYKNNILQYAGAQNPLYILSDGQIEVIKADMYGIGGSSMISKAYNPLKNKYTNHVIPLKKGMSVYLFSDGYIDQFGGNEKKKFGSQKFKDLLLEIQHQTMQKQKEAIASAHIKWKGHTTQIDDILVMGIRI